MKYTPFHENRFRASVDKALKRVEKILDSTRHPRLAEDEDHTYDDKYALVEFLTNAAVAAQMNAFVRLGLDPEKFGTVSKWVHDDHKTVTLRFKANDSCTFLKERDVDIVTGQREIEQETTESSAGGFMGITAGTKTEKVTAKIVAKVKEYHWKVEVSYSITIFAGSDPSNAVVLDSRTASTTVVTSGGQARPGSPGGKPPPPIPEATDHHPVDANVTWFFQMIEPEEQVCQFGVDRNADPSADDDKNNEKKSRCRTPRRNDDVDAAFEFNKGLLDWNLVAQGFFVQRVEREILAKHSPVSETGSSKPSSAKDKDSKGGAAAPDTVEPGTRAVITGLQKEPTFNGKHVTIVEYSTSQNRYKVEPVDKGGSSGLPGTLLIKPQNIKVQTSAHGPPLSGIPDDLVFCPVVPLMEKGSVLSMAEVGDFLTEQCRSMDEAIDGLTRTFAPRQLVRLVSVAEATVVLVCQHLQDLATSYQDSVDYVENMLKQQLVSAIGKEIQSKDFDQFMVFHNERLFGPEFAPKPFSRAVRRPGHYPDGTLSIECVKQKNEPIHTWVRHVSGGASAPSMFIPLSAATSIEITGDRYLHGWMQHRFKTKPKNDYQLVARARQFSSFVLILGTLAGADKFDPKDAIILQNKDEVLIPLLTNALPSAKEFKDSIASLSPEQQAFARSYRRMQLESSVFGVCVIQLKPQLEKLLGLPDGALTKEIQMTQDLMSLFVEYQIPSDLMSFDGAADTDMNTKVTAVKGYVKSIMDVIENAKEKQLVEEERKADMRTEMMAGGPSPMPFAAAAFGGAPLSDAFNSSEASLEGAIALMSDNSERAMLKGSSAARRNKGASMMLAKASPKGPGSSRSLTKNLAARLARPSPAAASVPVKLETVQPSSKGDTEAEASEVGPVEGEDFTMIPKVLDSCIEKFDSDNALKSTIIKAGPAWTLMRQANLLTPTKSSTLTGTAIDTEKKKAFDLLDAISRSGVLPIDCSELHVVVGVSHCFDNDVMGSIVQDNLNPIEKVERSGIMIASTIHSQPPKALIQNEQQTLRLANSFPSLFEVDAPMIQIYDEEHNAAQSRSSAAGVANLVSKLNKH